MKVTIAKNSKAVAFVAAVAKRNTMPVLNGIRVRTNTHLGPAAAELQGSDLDVTLTARFVSPDYSPEGGVAIIPTDSLVAASRGGGCLLDANCKTAELVRADGGSTVNTLPVEEWPSFDEWNPKIALSFDAGAFLGALKRVARAMSDQPTRYVLCGVLVEIRPDGINLVATDGRRLHWAKAQLLTGVAEKTNLIIRSSAIEQIIRLPKKGELRLEASGENVRVTVIDEYGDVFSVQSKQIDGNYPNWRQVLPDVEDSLKIRPKDLAAAVKAVVHCTNEKAKQVRLTILGAGGDKCDRIELETGNEAIGKASAVLSLGRPVKVREERTVAYDARLLLSLLEAMPDGEEPALIDFGWCDEKSNKYRPLSAESTDGLYLAVLMYMRAS